MGKGCSVFDDAFVTFYSNPSMWKVCFVFILIVRYSRFILASRAKPLKTVMFIQNACVENFDNWRQKTPKVRQSNFDNKIIANDKIFSIILLS